MTLDLPHLLDHSPAGWESWMISRGEPAFRARQLREEVFSHRRGDFQQMSTLPARLRQQLAEAWRLWAGQVAAHQGTPDGTEKLLLEWADGHRIECVLLRDGPRRTVCVSTQVGCAMGCVFCASGLEGVARNLTTGEILEQFLRLGQLLPAPERISHVVVMGMGEPLANLDRLLPALDQVHDARGLNISARRITISTVGLPEGILRLAAHQVPYQLAISLHAPDDLLRNELVPVNQRIGLAAILQAADEYFARSGRRVTYEYVLLGGVNDRPEHARKLAAQLAGRTALVNLIPYNPVVGLGYHTPTPEAVAQFVELLAARGLNVQVRQRKGDQIDAACGQLRRRQATAIDAANQSATSVRLRGATITPSESA